VFFDDVEKVSKKGHFWAVFGGSKKGSKFDQNRVFCDFRDFDDKLMLMM